MNNIECIIIVCIVALILVLLYNKYPERFTNLLEQSVKVTQSALSLEELNNQEFVTDELEDLEQESVLPLDKREEIDNMIDEIFESLNHNFNKRLVRINVERVEEKNIDDVTYYKVLVFVFNYMKESNAKILLEFSVNNENKVAVGKLEVVGSRSSILATRGGISTRDHEVSKFKKPVDMDKVEKLSFSTLDKSVFNVAETCDKTQDRNELILNKERIEIGNIDTFPERKVLPTWDCQGVNYTESIKKNTLNGLNHGSRPFTYSPKFMKHNFEICTGDYLWLFDKVEDTVSKPVGVA